MCFVNVEKRTYTRAELLEAATAQGTPASDRLVDDWVAVGLLDRPERRGLGRGRGSIATWSENQLELFLMLLHKRQRQGVRHQATLCNIPVFLWLYLGEEYVPLRQARRALGSWIGANRRSSWRRARHAARLVTEQLSYPGAPRGVVKNLEDEIAQAAFRGRLDPDQHERMRRLFELTLPAEERSRRGPLDPTPDSWLRVVEALLAATREFDLLTEEDFLRARAVVLTAVRDYWNLVLGRLQLPETVFRESAQRMVEERANEACRDVLLILGLQLLSRAERGVRR